MTNSIRATLRGIAIFTLIPVCISPGIIKSWFSRNFLPLALRGRMRWCRISLRILGVRIHTSGIIPEGGPYVFIGNHRSYLDPIVVLKDVHALPVAKAEVGSWPLIGYGAKATGIMYVKRESKGSRAATLEALRSYIRQGYSVLIYPEGTTHTEPRTRPFQRGAFRIAAEENIPVIPVAIEYLNEKDAWIGKETFLPHFMRCFGKPETHIGLRYGNPISGKDARELVRITHEWMDENIMALRSEFGKSTETNTPAPSNTPLSNAEE